MTKYSISNNLSVIVQLSCYCPAFLLQGITIEPILIIFIVIIRYISLIIFYFMKSDNKINQSYLVEGVV